MTEIDDREDPQAGDEPDGKSAGKPHLAELASLGGDPLLTISEVASIFRVSPKTVSRWESSGKLQAVRTLGGHRRFKTSEVQAALAGVSSEDELAD